MGGLSTATERASVAGLAVVLVTLGGCYTNLKTAPRVELEKDEPPPRVEQERNESPPRLVSPRVEMTPVTLRFGETVRYDNLTLRFDAVSDLRECRHNLDIVWPSAGQLSHWVEGQAIVNLTLWTGDEEFQWDLFTPSADPHSSEFVLGDYRVRFRCLMPVRVRYVSNGVPEDPGPVHPPESYELALFVGYHDSQMPYQRYPSVEPCSHAGH